MSWLIILAVLIIILAGLYGYNRLKVRQAESQFPPIGKFVTVEGLRLHYTTKGQGKSVVFLHGGILSIHDYLPVLDLAQHKYQAIAFDRPGYGYSDRPRNEVVTPIVQARLLHGALRELGIEKPILVGHSMSGALVLAYALNYPDEISGIVLLGAAFYGGEAYPAGKIDLLLSRMIQIPILGDLLVSTLLAPLGRKIMKPMVEATFSPDPVPPEYLKVATALGPRPGQLKANREDVLTFSPTAEELSQRYHEIRTPVTIVVGDSDPFKPDQQSYRLHQALPHSKLIVVPNTAHMIPQSRPQSVLDAIDHIAQEKNVVK